MSPLARVLYLLADYPVLSQTFVRNEVFALRDAGVAVDVLALNDGDPERTQRAWAGTYATVERRSGRQAVADVLWWLRRSPAGIGRMLRLTVQLRGAGMRVAWGRLPGALREGVAGGPVAAAHSHFGWRASTTCLYAGALLGVPTSVTLHANDIYRPAGDLRRKLRRFTRLVTVCQYNVGVIRRLSTRAAPITIVPCGVRVPAEPPAPLAGARLLSVGRMVPKKGFEDLVAAMESVWRSRPDAQLEIIGDGPGRPALEELVRLSSRPGSIRLSGSRDHGEVLSAMAECSVFVLACKPEPDGGSDALPVVIREAMARARPVVSTAVAGIPETLEGAGWVVEPGRPDALGAAILEALSLDEDVRQRATLARERTAALYTLDVTVSGMTQLFGIREDVA